MSLILLPSKIVRKKSEKVDVPLKGEDLIIANKMIKHIHNSIQEKNDLRPGIGIAAVQLGYLKNMTYINTWEGFEDFLVNPIIFGKSLGYAALSNGEGCLSVPEDWPKQDGLVHRKNQIIVKAWSHLKQKEVTINKSGFEAIVLQHEIDHMNGKLFIDRINTNSRWVVKENEQIIK
ncbi:MAG: peptide deformylase [Mollicutes bacterium PWAP]|nr:peptide deformylase [Mollicutes bacterium PWAP]